MILSDPDTMFSFEGIIAKPLDHLECACKLVINLNLVESHTFIVLSYEPDTIFSFEGIIAKVKIARVCPVNIAINTES